ncbi:MAG: hypothetical protein U9N32_08765 [Spirochaetota bacterium]|nr:hypothetical protein [Spirochaetota bacterium]
MSEKEIEQTQYNQDRPVTTFTAIMIAVFLMGSGSALQGTALVIRAGIEGFPETIIGIIMSVYYAGVAIGIFIAAPTMRSVGYVRSFAAFASIASTTAILHIIIIDPYAWIIFRFINGLCLSVMVVVVESCHHLSEPFAGLHWLEVVYL